MLANDRWDLIRCLKGCMKNHQIHQLFILFINYVWWLLHVSALHCHLQGAFLVPSQSCSIEEQSIEYCGWAHHVTRHNTPTHNILSTASQLSISQKALETFPEDGNVMILIFKGLTAQRLYMSFGLKRLKA